MVLLMITKQPRFQRGSMTAYLWARLFNAVSLWRRALLYQEAIAFPGPNCPGEPECPAVFLHQSATWCSSEGQWRRRRRHGFGQEKDERGGRGAPRSAEGNGIRERCGLADRSRCVLRGGRGESAGGRFGKAGGSVSQAARSRQGLSGTSRCLSKHDGRLREEGDVDVATSQG